MVVVVVSACASSTHTAGVPVSAALPVSKATPPRTEVRSDVNLIAFVGRRIAVHPVMPKGGEVAFDAEYAATFEVLEVVFGSYAKKQISFSSYVHIGEPGYLKHEVGLVYVSKYEGRFVQQKYLFQRLYPTKDGRWAGCGDPYEYMPDIHRHGVKPEPIVFEPPVQIDTRQRSEWEPKRKFPAPLYRVEGNAAVCLMGNYPADLYRVMAEGYLKARGVFDGNPD